MITYDQPRPSPAVGERREVDFRALVARVAACRRCPTMEGRRRVLSEQNGRVDARVLFVAEAPGRFGGERTGVPLSADQSGRAFERLIAAAGLTRGEIFVTNAVVCNPRDGRGRNRRPNPTELASCAAHLVDQLDLVAAPLVVALGVTALRALERIAPHGLTQRGDVGRPAPWRGRTLVALYHPGPQAMIHRPFARQVEDYRALGVLVRSVAAPSS
jgi:uracil-DNA glycosylase family 4